MRIRVRVITGCWLLVCMFTAGGASSWASAVPSRHSPARTSSTAPRRRLPVRPPLPTVSRPLPARTAAPSRAASPDAQLQGVQQQLADERRRLALTTRQEHQVLGELSHTEERLHVAEAQLHKTTAALSGTKRAVADANEALGAVSRRLAIHEQLMEERLRAFYKDGPLGYLDVLLGAADFRDFVARSYLLGLIVSRDLRLYQQVTEERDRRDEVRTTLTQREADLAVQRKQWVVSRQETAALAVQRRRILAQIRVQRETQEAAIRELEAESFRITEIIRQRQRGSHFGGRWSLAGGTLRWPASGPITSGFGWRIHPIFHTRQLHTGIDIGAPWGAPVEAAADGTVLYVGWMTGYGNVVVLDLGNGLSSIYAHLSSYLVRIGETVRRGQVIARVGSTGWSTGPHLHFEMRQDGQPYDPLAP